MGVFALCHHLLVRCSIIKTGFNAGCGNYTLLGDDLVIGDNDVEAGYPDLIRGRGVEISTQRSSVLKHTSELARRRHSDNVEISGFHSISF